MWCDKYGHQSSPSQLQQPDPLVGWGEPATLSLYDGAHAAAPPPPDLSAPDLSADHEQAAAHAPDIVPEGQPNRRAPYEEDADLLGFAVKCGFDVLVRVDGTLRPEPPPRTPRSTRASPPPASHGEESTASHEVLVRAPRQ